MHFLAGIFGAFLMVGFPAFIWKSGQRWWAIGFTTVGVALMAWSNWQWLLIWAIIIALSTLQAAWRQKRRKTPSQENDTHQG